MPKLTALAIPKRGGVELARTQAPRTASVRSLASVREHTQEHVVLLARQTVRACEQSVSHTRVSCETRASVLSCK